MQFLKSVHQLVVKGYIALVNLVICEHEHIYQRHTVLRKPIYDVAVVLVVYGISRIQHLRHLVIEVHKLGELSWGELIRQYIAVHCLNVGKPHAGLHLGIALQGTISAARLVVPKLSLIFCTAICDSLWRGVSRSEVP